MGGLCSSCRSKTHRSSIPIKKDTDNKNTINNSDGADTTNKDNKDDNSSSSISSIKSKGIKHKNGMKSKEEEEEESTVVKMFLMGAGESGKSTIFKQMRVLYGSKFDEEELRMYGLIVRANITVAIRRICRTVKILKIEDDLEGSSATDIDESTCNTVRAAYNRLSKSFDGARKGGLAGYSGDSCSNPKKGAESDSLHDGKGDSWGSNSDKNLKDSSSKTSQTIFVDFDADIRYVEEDDNTGLGSGLGSGLSFGVDCANEYYVDGKENIDVSDFSIDGNIESENKESQPPPPPRPQLQQRPESVITMKLKAPPSDDWIGISAYPLVSRAIILDANRFLARVNDFHTLWSSPLIQEKVWSKNKQLLSMVDNHSTYLNEMLEIASPKYRTTQRHVLLSRVRTDEVVEQKYNIDGTIFKVFDAGGQRSERRKWLDWFGIVDAVVYVAALSEYDEYLREARKTNRLMEALNLLNSLTRKASFNDVSFILFLNKKDLFKEKVMNGACIGDIREFKNDFVGRPRHYGDALQYFKKKFKEAATHSGKCRLEDTFIHVTCATDSDSMKKVLDSTREILLRQSLKQSGLGF